MNCGGDVRIDAMSAADAELAERNPSLAEARATRVETRGVTFNRPTGLARTDQRVTFAFPSGTGDGIGLEYNSDEGTLRLQHDVRLRLTQAPATAAKKTGISASVDPKAGQDVRVKGSSLDFSRDSRLLHLFGPAEAETTAERLTAGELTLSLDEDFRAQTLIASTTGQDRPRVVSTKSGEEMNLESDNLTAHFVPDGWITKLDATGHVTGFRKNATDEDAMSGDTGSLTFWPRFSQPKELNVNGNVVLRTKEEKTGDTRTMQTAAFPHGIQRRQGARIQQAAHRRNARRRHDGVDRLDHARRHDRPRQNATPGRQTRDDLRRRHRQSRKKSTPTATSAPNAGSPVTRCRPRPPPPEPRSCRQTAAGRRWICKAT